MKKSGGREDGSPAFDRRSRCDRFFALNRRRHRREICRQQRERPRPMLEQPPRREREGSDPAKLAWRKRAEAKRIFDFTLHPDDLYFFSPKSQILRRRRKREGEGGRSQRSKLAPTTSTSDYCKRPFPRSAPLAPEPRSEVSAHPRFEQAASESESVSVCVRPGYCDTAGSEQEMAKRRK